MNEFVLIVGVLVLVGGVYFYKRKVKAENVAPQATNVAPEATPNPGTNVPNPGVLTGVPGNEVVVNPVTWAFLQSGTNQQVAGPETVNAPADQSGTEITGSGNYKMNVHKAGEAKGYALTLAKPGTVQFWYALTSGGNSGAQVTSRIDGPVTSPPETRTIMNSQSFYLECVPGRYTFVVQPHEGMPIQVGAYF